jgi:hypothetical protein
MQTKGIKYSNIRIGFINGMNTTYEEALAHLEYIRKFTGEMSVEGVYNHSHTWFGDLVEIGALNYAGFAPNTADLLIENWTRFHEENINNPDAKYLQFAHSMGTILTRNALEQVPQEIRDRIIVVSIGPAVVISKDLCYESTPYASKNDFIHLGENIFAYITSGSMSNETDNRQILENYLKVAENKKHLKLLDQHPDSGLIGHSFQDPVFAKIISENIQEYLDKKGDYK